jgi:hypothetical protein
MILIAGKINLNLDFLVKNQTNNVGDNKFQIFHAKCLILNAGNG